MQCLHVVSDRHSFRSADEPTGALDSKTSVEVMQILKDLHKLGMICGWVIKARAMATRCF